MDARVPIVSDAPFRSQALGNDHLAELARTLAAQWPATVRPGAHSLLRRLRDNEHVLHVARDEAAHAADAKEPLRQALSDAPTYCRWFELLVPSGLPRHPTTTHRQWRPVLDCAVGRWNVACCRARTVYTFSVSHRTSIELDEVFSMSLDAYSARPGSGKPSRRPFARSSAPVDETACASASVLAPGSIEVQRSFRPPDQLHDGQALHRHKRMASRRPPIC